MKYSYQFHSVALTALLTACGGGGGGGSSTPVPPAPDPCDGSITGQVWNDNNGNGAFDTGEAALTGLDIELVDSQDMVLGTVSSSAQGYSFADLCAGDYSTRVIPGPGLSITVMDAADDTLDSDADPTSGQTNPITLQESMAVENVSFGLFDPETLDSDDDGVRDIDDAFPQDPSETTDTDNDGVGDVADAFPNDNSEQLDSDNDGIGDNADPSPLILPPGELPSAFTAVFSAGDSVTRDRPLAGWGDFYARRVATSLSLPYTNAARSGWTLEQILNGDGSFNQLDFLYGTPRTADPNALHIVYGGYNDVFFRPNAFQFDVVNESAESLRSILLEIANAGGRFVIVPLLYDVGKQIASDADGIRGTLTQRTNDFNQAALDVVSAINTGTDMTVVTYDVFALVEDIYANPVSNGFTNLTASCNGTQAACSGFFWWDDAHPGDDVHQLIADGLLEIINP